MSIKKDIINLVMSEEGTVRINEITTIIRWTKNAVNAPVDRMVVTFAHVAGVRGGQTFDISARDYDGILKEIADCTHIYLENCADQMIQNMKNGYL